MAEAARRQILTDLLQNAMRSKKIKVTIPGTRCVGDVSLNRSAVVYEFEEE
jgi:hypothetical protein